MKLETVISMQGRALFESIAIESSKRPGFKPFTTSQLPNAKNHCGAVALANVLKLHNLIEDNNKSLFDVYKKVGNGPVIFLSRIIRTEYRLLVCRYRKPFNINPTNFESVCYLVCAPLSFIEWHWFVIVDVVKVNNEDYYVVFDGWNPTVRYVKIDSLKYGMILEIKKAPTN